MEVKGNSYWSKLKHKIKFIKKNESVEYGEKKTMMRTTINCKVK